MVLVTLEPPPPKLGVTHWSLRLSTLTWATYEFAGRQDLA